MAEEYLTDDEQLEHVKRLARGIRPLDARRGRHRSGLYVSACAITRHHRNELALQAAAQFGRHGGRASAQRPRQGAAASPRA